MAEGRLERHVRVEGAVTALDALRGETSLSAGRIKLAMTRGAVWLTRGRHTQRIRRAKRELRSGDALHLYYDPDVLSREPKAPALVEDVKAYSVWDKPYGLLSQGSRWGDHCTLTRWAEQHLVPQRSAFVVHRLDRAASGLMVIAHEKRVAAALSAQFRERRVLKHYAALVNGRLATSLPSTVDTPLDGREAVTTVLSQSPGSRAGQTLVHVKIETGRRHQVRRHLLELGCPIVGDRMYGGREEVTDLKLKAVRLEFVCPVSGKWRAYELPADLDSPPPARTGS